MGRICVCVCVRFLVDLCLITFLRFSIRILALVAIELTGIRFTFPTRIICRNISGFVLPAVNKLENSFCCIYIYIYFHSIPINMVLYLPNGIDTWASANKCRWHGFSICYTSLTDATWDDVWVIFWRPLVISNNVVWSVKAFSQFFNSHQCANNTVKGPVTQRFTAWSRPKPVKKLSPVKQTMLFALMSSLRRATADL